MVDFPASDPLDGTFCLTIPHYQEFSGFKPERQGTPSVHWGNSGNTFSFFYEFWRSGSAVSGWWSGLQRGQSDATEQIPGESQLQWSHLAGHGVGMIWCLKKVLWSFFDWMFGYPYIRNLKKLPKKEDTEELRVGRTSIGCNDLPQWMHINSWCMCMPCAVGSTGDPGLRGVASLTCISGQFRLFILLIGTLPWQSGRMACMWSVLAGLSCRILLCSWTERWLQQESWDFWFDFFLRSCFRWECHIGAKVLKKLFLISMGALYTMIPQVSPFMSQEVPRFHRS